MSEREPISLEIDDSEIERVNRKSEIVNRSILTEPAALEKIGTGTLCVLSENADGRIYGRTFTVADRLKDDRIVMSKWVRRLTGWNGRQAPLAIWKEKIAPLLEKKLAQQKTPVVRFTNHPHKIVAQVSLAELTMRAPVDSHGVALWKPQEREVLPPDCARCSLVPTCRRLLTATGTALLWRRLGLVDAAGVPTKRGRIVSFFQQGDGLAIAAALEEESYPLDELIYDLADLDAGFRFCGEENRWAGRLAMVCHERFGLQSIPGYLENGVPPKYGSGAEQIVASVHKNPLTKHAWVTDLLGGVCCGRSRTRPTSTGPAGARCKKWRRLSWVKPSRRRSPICRRWSITRPSAWIIGLFCGGISREISKRGGAAIKSSSFSSSIASFPTTRTRTRTRDSRRLRRFGVKSLPSSAVLWLTQRNGRARRNPGTD